MLQQVIISSQHPFDFKEFEALLGMKNLVLAISPAEIPNAWGFYRKEHSLTLFTLEREEEGYILSMDNLATYDDYALFPYLVDSLNAYLRDTPYETEEGENAFQAFDEDWIEYTIGEEIAYLKCLLSIGQKYYIELPLCEGFPYITEQLLNQYGVTLHSSSPRIYGYIHYLLRNQSLPTDAMREEIVIEAEYLDVPQHESIGVVTSWQTDGAETTESYAKEDTELLLAIGKRYEAGERYPGVVLNDIGTIYEHGLGVERDIRQAIHWYREALSQGDRYYAPTNLGDVYRRGLIDGKRDGALALEAYHQSEDPYAWYRIGQAFEEGWVEQPDMQQAMVWYQKAAAVGHHLAKKRLNLA